MRKNLSAAWGVLIVAAAVAAVSSSAGTLSSPTVWFDDALPAGASGAADGGDAWNWVGNNPSPYSGSLAHQSTVASGLHEHFFNFAGTPFPVNTGDILFTYVYLDPANPPSELMLAWNADNWEHRAYWGANDINYGTDGSSSRYHVGPLPALGQWVRLEVPASQVNLEGQGLTGMDFALYDGGATWDYAGSYSGASLTTNTTQSTTNTTQTTTNNVPAVTTGLPLLSSTNSIPSTNDVNYIALVLPKPGEATLNILSPTLLELKLITTKAPDPTVPSQWNFVDANFQFQPPAPGQIVVGVNGQSVSVQGIGFKRRPLYAPLAVYDLRIDNCLYIQLASPITDNQTVQVVNPDATLWSTNLTFAAVAAPLRYNPAIHINQEGYLPALPKKAMIGYYAGNLGEMPVPAASGFQIIDNSSGNVVFQGPLSSRPDSGYNYSPLPYQQVYQADFSAFTTPGEYRLAVPGLGASLPFLIDDGIAMGYARAYELGLYHQRCGTNNALPFTRFVHDPCHIAAASVPSPASSFSFTWNTISNYAATINSENPPQIAPLLTSESAQLFPFVNKGTIDVSGGHHDAGDYSKYTINEASLVHHLMFAVDSLPGVAGLDNLGIPESGDGISDIMQETKWVADFLVKMQDADGGFYFLVYPQNREYESNVLPDQGDAQVVWPKNTAVTAAAVAALAQCSSSPRFKAQYPATAALYWQKAQLGWSFLTNAIAKYGKTGAYQKITFYGDHYADQDELAWAVCQMFLATGDPSYQQLLISWFNPADPATWRWGWWHLSESYGNAIRSFAFAAQSGRLAASQLDPTFLAKCQTEIATAGDDALGWSQENAYGTSFPDATKRVMGAGWYFSVDQAYDMVVAYQLNPKPAYLDALLQNMNYEGGCNPVNVAYITGMGWKRQREIVHQYAQNDRRVMPPSGLPLGNIQQGFMDLNNYGAELGELCFPQDGNATAAPYPFYDRWGDSFNVTTEFVILNQARSLAATAFLSTLTSVKTQAWTSVAGQIQAPTNVVQIGASVTVSLQVPGMDLSQARIVWEARDQEPAYGSTYTFAPVNNGAQWVEAEAQWPDGRRAFAAANFSANSTNVVWVDDALPAGATPGADGGDSWTWLNANPTPIAGVLDHQSAIAAGEHEHYFSGATAPLVISIGDILYTYVYLDPLNPPTEVMLMWYDGSWEHRAYWGANNISYGADGSAGRHYEGPLPAVDNWVLLQVPASDVGLDGSTLTGMGFSLYDGRATWDASGKSTPSFNPVPAGGVPANTPPPPTISLTVNATTASRITPSVSRITVTRNGDTSTALSVNYTTTGTAVNGSDYYSVNSPATIPAGAVSTTIPIMPHTATTLVGPKTVSISLSNNANYVIGTSNIVVTISGNAIAGSTIHKVPGGIRITWPSSAGRIYRVAHKAALSDPWTDLSGNITATSPSTSWGEPAVSTQGFYAVYVIN